jgi:hypothetical protein
MGSWQITGLAECTIAARPVLFCHTNWDDRNARVILCSQTLQRYKHLANEQQIRLCHLGDSTNRVVIVGLAAINVQAIESMANLLAQLIWPDLELFVYVFVDALPWDSASLFVAQMVACRTKNGVIGATDRSS